MPGENFAHEHRCPAVGNRVMSSPTSAMMIAGRDRSDPGDLVQALDRRVEGGQVCLDLGVQHGDVGIDGVDTAEHPFQQEPVVVIEAARRQPGERLLGDPDLGSCRMCAFSVSTRRGSHGSCDRSSAKARCRTDVMP